MADKLEKGVLIIVVILLVILRILLLQHIMVVRAASEWKLLMAHAMETRATSTHAPVKHVKTPVAVIQLHYSHLRVM